MESINNIKAYIRHLQEEIEKRRHLINKAPEGSLFSRKSPDGKYKYFKRVIQSGEPLEIYLRKDQTEDAVLLAKK